MNGAGLWVDGRGVGSWTVGTEKGRKILVSAGSFSTMSFSPLGGRAMAGIVGWCIQMTTHTVLAMYTHTVHSAWCVHSATDVNGMPTLPPVWVLFVCDV